MTIGERIRYLRKTVLHVTQEEFVKGLKISRSNIGNIEIGSIGVTDRVISDICEKYNVNENWLRSGNGDIIEQLTDQQKIMKYTALLLKDTDSVVATAIKNFIITYEQLDDTSKKVLEDVALKYLENMKRGQ